MDAEDIKPHPPLATFQTEPENTQGEAPQHDPFSDSLPQWLYQRFTHVEFAGIPVKHWDDLSDNETSFWAHEAAAVRRAVARGGFKDPTSTQRNADIDAADEDD